MLTVKITYLGRKRPTIDSVLGAHSVDAPKMKDDLANFVMVCEGSSGYVDDMGSSFIQKDLDIMACVDQSATHLEKAMKRITIKNKNGITSRR